MIAEGDKVVGRVTWRGIHKDELMGIPPTGKKVTVEGIDIIRFANGQAVENWFSGDTLGLMQPRRNARIRSERSLSEKEEMPMDRTF